MQASQILVSANAAPSSHLPVPTVASYCTTFLKPEMLHIYRQVTGLRRYETFIVAKERTSEERFPFPDVEMVPRKPRKNFIRRFWLKHVRHLPALYYRGEMQGLMKIFRRRNADLMHIYFGHTGVHLLPFVKGWGRPCVVSFHGADVMPRGISLSTMANCASASHHPPRPRPLPFARRAPQGPWLFPG